MAVAPDPIVGFTTLLAQMRQHRELDPDVLRAMAEVPRALFVPREVADQAYDDRPLSIGHGQTISQPSMVAIMTSLLDVKPTHRVLDVGTGSGYQAAVLAKLVGDVFSIERVKPLLDESFERLGLLGLKNVRLRLGDGSMGWPERAPFDRILVAAASPSVPPRLADQLAEGGVLVVPVGSRDEQRLIKLTKRNGRLEQTNSIACRFVPLVGEAGWPA